MENPTHTNRLIHSSSPYLLQHAHNPVDWYEWGDEAFEKARREDKLVLVSIGYSACHWCHVMEREAFEKEDTAAIMNEHFVCIKVDREERPDVDQLYMDAVQLLTGRGGWPLNCFVLPDGRPIHGGTYFPKAEWERVLQSLSGFYQTNREEALKYATELTSGIRKLNLVEQPTGTGWLETKEINTLVHNRKRDMDPELGGFTWAPKFPMPVSWELFLKQYQYTKDEELLKAVRITLTRMAEGGIYDQVGGGFSRYSTDVFWKVPHFEKMLYDNAQLVSLYCQAYQAEPDELYHAKVTETLEFIARELTSGEGVFYSALDADSEGVEGKFYTWTQKELRQLLGGDEPLYSLYYSVDAYGNWEEGTNILYKTRTDEELKNVTGKTAEEIEAVIKACNHKLLAQRAHRVRPGLDDKMITSWNALMIKAYADAFLTFRSETYLQAAEKAADFIIGNMWKEQRLLRIYKDGKSSIPGFAEDYALTCESFIRLYEASAEERYLLFAKEVLDAAMQEFYDEEKGICYFRSVKDAPLVAAKADLNDDVIPSSNAVLAKCLLVMGYLFDENSYHEQCDRLLVNASSRARKNPAGYSYWLQVMLLRNHGVHQVIISGEGASRYASDLLSSAGVPDVILAYAAENTRVPLVKEKPANGDLKFYVCHNKTCGLPVNSVQQAGQLLQP